METTVSLTAPDEEVKMTEDEQAREDMEMTKPHGPSRDDGAQVVDDDDNELAEPRDDLPGNEVDASKDKQVSNDHEVTKLRITSLSKTNRTRIIVGGIVAILLAVIGVNYTINSNNTNNSYNKSDSNNTTSSTITVVVDDATCVMIGGTGGHCYSMAHTPDEEAAVIEKLATDVAASGNPQPADAPWTYVVVGTGGKNGLYVRDGTKLEDNRLHLPTGEEASFLEGDYFYADCRVHDWALKDDPLFPWNEPQGKGWWLKVRWPEPANQGEHYVSTGWAAPIGHNGLIPEC